MVQDVTCHLVVTNITLINFMSHPTREKLCLYKKLIKLHIAGEIVAFEGGYKPPILLSQHNHEKQALNICPYTYRYVYSVTVAKETSVGNRDHLAYKTTANQMQS